MTRTYVLKASIIIQVEADNHDEALASAEEMIAELEASMPTGATLVQKNGQAEVNFIP